MEHGKYKIHNKKYIKKAIDQIEKDLGIHLKKENVLVHLKYYLELETLRILVNNEIIDYQKYMGIL